MMYKVSPTSGDRLVRFFIRHERLFGIAGMLWLAVSCASYARFIELPVIPFVTDATALYISAAYNAIWWGFLRPAVDRRKAALKRNSDYAEIVSADEA